MSFRDKYTNPDFIRSESYMVDGALFWNSSHNPIPMDCLEESGMDFDRVAQRKALDDQLTRIVEQMRNHVPSDEEMFEMRAAFGEGAEVVNVFTGKVTKL